MLFAFLSQRPRTRRQVWNMISQSHQRFQFCPSSPWSNCCTPVGGKRRMNSFSEYFFSVQTTQFIPVTNNIMRWNLKRTLFSSGVKWFIQSPTIPFLMNWPLPCLLQRLRTRYFLKAVFFQHTEYSLICQAPLIRPKNRHWSQPETILHEAPQGTAALFD